MARRPRPAKPQEGAAIVDAVGHIRGQDPAMPPVTLLVSDFPRSLRRRAPRRRRTRADRGRVTLIVGAHWLARRSGRPQHVQWATAVALATRTSLREGPFWISILSYMFGGISAYTALLLLLPAQRAGLTWIVDALGRPLLHLWQSPSTMVTGGLSLMIAAMVLVRVQLAIAHLEARQTAERWGFTPPRPRWRWLRQIDRGVRWLTTGSTGPQPASWNRRGPAPARDKVDSQGLRPGNGTR